MAEQTFMERYLANQNKPSDFDSINTNLDTTKQENFNTSSYFNPVIKDLEDSKNFNISSTTPTNVIDTRNKIGVASSNISGIVNKDMATELASQRSLRPVNKFETDLETGVNRLRDYSSGESQVDRTIANRALNRFDATAAAANLNQSQRIASNPILSTGAKILAKAELARTTGSQRAELTGQLAQQSQERAYTATEKYAQTAQLAAEYEEGKFKTDLAAVSDKLRRELDANIAMGNLASTEANLALVLGPYSMVASCSV
jgi:hypothetical protein